MSMIANTLLFSGLFRNLDYYSLIINWAVINSPEQIQYPAEPGFLKKSVQLSACDKNHFCYGDGFVNLC